MSCPNLVLLKTRLAMMFVTTTLDIAPIDLRGIGTLVSKTMTTTTKFDIKEILFKRHGYYRQPGSNNNGPTHK
jgi:hypothetical protein